MFKSKKTTQKNSVRGANGAADSGAHNPANEMVTFVSRCRLLDDTMQTDGKPVTPQRPIASTFLNAIGGAFAATGNSFDDRVATEMAVYLLGRSEGMLNGPLIGMDIDEIEVLHRAFSAMRSDHYDVLDKFRTFVRVLTEFVDGREVREFDAVRIISTASSMVVARENALTYSNLLPFKVSEPPSNVDDLCDWFGKTTDKIVAYESFLVEFQGLRDIISAYDSNYYFPTSLYKFTDVEEELAYITSHYQCGRVYTLGMLGSFRLVRNFVEQICEIYREYFCARDAIWDLFRMLNTMYGANDTVLARSEGFVLDYGGVGGECTLLEVLCRELKKVEMLFPFTDGVSANDYASCESFSQFHVMVMTIETNVREYEIARGDFQNLCTVQEYVKSCRKTDQSADDEVDWYLRVSKMFNEHSDDDEEMTDNDDVVSLPELVSI